MMNFFRFGLRTEIILSLVILMIAAIILISVVMLKVTEQNILEQKLESGRVLVHSLQHSIDLIFEKDSRAFQNKADAERLARLVKLFGKERGVNKLFFFNREQKVVAHSKDGMTGAMYIDGEIEEVISTGKIITRFSKESKWFFRRVGTELVITAPVFAQSEIVGGIRARLSLADVQNSIIRSQKIILLYIFFDAVIIVIFGSLLLSRVIVKPVRELLKATERIAEGDFEHRLEDTSVNEIGKVSMALNRMSRRLQDHVGSLEKTNMELRKAQEEVIRSEKLASVGRLAAGVAHEIGNPIGAILGYVHFLEEGTSNKEEERDYLDRIRAESNRINTIVSNLLDFSRPSKIEIKDTDINEVINNTISLLSPQKILQNIEIDLQLEEGLPSVLVDENQLQQVMINLTINANDAMPDGGKLDIRTSRTYPEITAQTWRITGKSREEVEMEILSQRRKDDPSDLDYSHLRRGYILPSIHRMQKEAISYIVISFSDTGCGIKKEDSTKVFDPFFTTKPPGRGTGLGLTNCLRIIESFSGQIKVETEEGEGTTFTILLPIVKGEGR